MIKSQVTDLLQTKYDLNHILASSIAIKSKYELKSEDSVESIFAWFQENKSKPFVKWVGGKRQLLKQFKSMSLYPPKDFDSTKARYFEPFVGGGAVFFDLLPQKSILSDMNLELVTNYNVIKNDVEELIKKLWVLQAI